MLRYKSQHVVPRFHTGCKVGFREWTHIMLFLQDTGHETIKQ